MNPRVGKVITWRLISVLITMLVIWVFTGDIKEATGFTVFLHILLTIANYIFEVCWEGYHGNR